MSKKERIEHIFKCWKSQNPHPVGELWHQNNYQFLVAVVLSAQATDVGVNKATKPLFAKVTTPEDMLDLGHEGLLDAIRSIGLFRSKAKHVMALSQLLIDKHKSQVPNTLSALMALPGVGRKTANVVLNGAFSEPTIAVDTHVYRVARRLGFSKKNTVDAVEQDLLRVVPSVYKMHAHHWMILHGRYVCKARTPLCGDCPILSWCEEIQR